MDTAHSSPLPEKSSNFDDRQWLGRNENPMLNILIAERLFEIIPFNCNDFKSLRLVCNFWADLTYERWRQEAWVLVKDKDKRPGISPSAYLQLLQMNGDPYELTGKYRFRNFKVIMTNLDRESNLEFWNSVGSSIDKLDIMETRGSGALWRQVLFTLTPNVMELSLKNNVYGWDYFLDRSLRWEERLRPQHAEIRRNLIKLEVIMKWNTSRFPVNWATLLGRFPNLQSLKIQGTTVPPRRSYWTDNTANGNVACFFESMRIVRENLRQEIPLRHLDILNLQLKALSTLPATIPTLLEGLALPISSLALDVGYQNNETGPFSRILNMYSNTLERLVAYRAPYSDPFEEDFPFGTDLPLLTELILIGPICKNLDFLSRTPKLKILVLWNGNNQMKQPPPHSYLDYALPHITQKKVKGKKFIKPKDNNFLSENLEGTVVLPSMEEFVVGYQLCETEHIEALVKIMPNLKKIRLGLGNDSFRKVCELWKDKLQYLDIEPFNLNEEGLLGIKDGMTRKFPNLLDLKYLTTFRIGLSSVHWTLGQLTPRMIRDGLFAAKLLENVTIVNSPVGILNHIDKDLKEKFLDKFPQ